MGQETSVDRWLTLLEERSGRNAVELVTSLANHLWQWEGDSFQLQSMASVADLNETEIPAALRWTEMAKINDEHLAAAVAQAMVIFTFLQPCEDVLPSKDEPTVRHLQVEVARRQKLYENLVRNLTRPFPPFF